MVEQIYIVVGLGYGDEGKGLTVDYLCSKSKKPLVIRFNGGQQAGHCVVNEKGEEHIFSNFGAGTFRDAPTYWSKFCTFSPYFFIQESEILNYNSTFYIDEACPVSTHYDLLYNRTLEDSLGQNRIGSCGLGFGATLSREASGINFVVSDLLQPEVVNSKLKEIRQYYRLKVNLETDYDFGKFDHEGEDNFFLTSVDKFKTMIVDGTVLPTNEKFFFSNLLNFSTLIFEGAQGILLDKTFGKKPHVTKSNCTTQNAFELLSRNDIKANTDVYYVTRCYQTRHGAGSFREIDNLQLRNNQTETNVYNQYQGRFKKSYLDLNQLNGALVYDSKFSEIANKNLLVTCLDQIDSDFITYYNGDDVVSVHYRKFHELLAIEFESVLYGFGRSAAKITQ